MARYEYSSGYFMYRNDPYWASSEMDYEDNTDIASISTMITIPPVAASIVGLSQIARSRVRKRFYSDIRGHYNRNLVRRSNIGLQDKSPNSPAREFYNKVYDELHDIGRKAGNLTPRDVRRLSDLMKLTPESGYSGVHVMTSRSKSGVSRFFTESGDNKLESMDKFGDEPINVIIEKKSAVNVTQNAAHFRTSSVTGRTIQRLKDVFIDDGMEVKNQYLDRNTNMLVLEIGKPGRPDVKIRLPYFAHDLSVAPSMSARIAKVADAKDFVKTMMHQHGFYGPNPGKQFAQEWGLDTTTSRGIGGKGGVILTPAAMFESEFEKHIGIITGALSRGNGLEKAIRTFENNVVFHESFRINQAADYLQDISRSKFANQIQMLSPVRERQKYQRELNKISAAQGINRTDIRAAEKNAMEQAINEMYGEIYADDTNKTAQQYQRNANRVIYIYNSDTRKVEAKPYTGSLFDFNQVSANQLADKFKISFADENIVNYGGGVATPSIYSRAPYLPGIRTSTLMGTRESLEGVKDMTDVDLMRYSVTDRGRVGTIDGRLRAAAVANFGVTYVNEDMDTFKGDTGITIRADTKGKTTGFGDVIAAYKEGRVGKVAAVRYEHEVVLGRNIKVTTYDIGGGEGGKFPAISPEQGFGFGYIKDGGLQHNRKLIKRLKEKFVIASTNGKNTVKLSGEEAKAIGVDVKNQMGRGHDGSYTVMFEGEVKPEALGSLGQEIKLKIYSADNTLLPYLQTYKTIERNTYTPMTVSQMREALTRQGAGAYTALLTGATKGGTELMLGKDAINKQATKITLGTFTKVLDNLVKRDLPKASYQMIKSRGEIKYMKVVDPEFLKLANTMFDTIVRGKDTAKMEKPSTFITAIFKPVDGSPVEYETAQGTRFTDADIVTTDGMGKMRIADPMLNQEVSKQISKYVDMRKSADEKMVSIQEYAKSPITMELQQALKVSDQGIDAPVVYEVVNGAIKVKTLNVYAHTGAIAGTFMDEITPKRLVGVEGMQGGIKIGQFEIMALRDRNEDFANHMSSLIREQVRRTRLPAYFANELNRAVFRESETSAKWRIAADAQAKKNSIYNKLQRFLDDTKVYRDVTDQNGIFLSEHISSVHDKLVKQVSGIVEKNFGADIKSLHLDNSAIWKVRENVELEVENLVKDLIGANRNNFMFDDKSAVTMIKRMQEMVNVNIHGQNLIGVELRHPTPIQVGNAVRTGHVVQTNMLYLNPLNMNEMVPSPDYFIGRMEEGMDATSRTKKLVRARAMSSHGNDVLNLFSLLRLSEHVGKPSRTGNPTSDIINNNTHELVQGILTQGIQRAVTNSVNNIATGLSGQVSGKENLSKLTSTRAPYSTYAQITSSTLMRSIHNSAETGVVYISKQKLQNMMGGSLVGVDEAYRTIRSSLARNIEDQLRMSIGEDAIDHLKSKHATSINVKDHHKFMKAQRRLKLGFGDTLQDMLSRSIQDGAKDPEWSMRDLRTRLLDIHTGRDTASMMFGHIKGAFGKAADGETSRKVNLLLDALNEYMHQQTTADNESKARSLRKVVNAYDVARSHLLGSEVFSYDKMFSQNERAGVKTFHKMVTAIESGMIGLERNTGKSLQYWANADLTDTVWHNALEDMVGTNIQKERWPYKKGMGYKTMKKVVARERRQIERTNPWKGEGRINGTMAAIMELKNLVGKENDIPHIERKAKEIRRLTEQITNGLKGFFPEKHLNGFIDDVEQGLRVFMQNKDQVDMVRQYVAMAHKGGAFGYLQANPNLQTTHGMTYAMRILDHRVLRENLKHMPDGPEKTKLIKETIDTMSSKGSHIMMDPYEALLQDRDFDGDAVPLFATLIDEKHGLLGAKSVTASQLFGFMHDRMFLREGNSMRAANMTSARTLENFTHGGGAASINSFEVETVEEYLKRNRSVIQGYLKMHGHNLGIDFDNEVQGVHKEVLKKIGVYVEGKGDSKLLKDVVILKRHKGSMIATPQTSGEITFQGSDGQIISIGREAGKVESFLKASGMLTYEGAGREHLAQLRDQTKDAKNLADEFRNRAAELKSEGIEVFNQALENLRRGPAELRSAYAQKTLTGRLYKYTWLMRMISKTSLRTDGINGEIGKAASMLAENMQYLLVQMPAIQGKKGVPNVEKEIHNLYKAMLYGGDDNPYTSHPSSGQEKYHALKERILAGNVEVEIGEYERRLLADSGYTTIDKKKLTVNSIARFHTAKAIVADAMVQHVNDIQSGKTVSALDSYLTNGMSDQQSQALVGTLRKKVFSRDTFGNISDDSIKNLAKTMSGHVLRMDAGPELLRHGVGPEHAGAVLKALAVSSADKAHASKDFLVKLLNFQAISMNVGAKVFTSAKQNGTLDGIRQAYNMVMSVNDTHINKRTFADSLGNMIEREMAAGKGSNYLLDLYHTILPEEMMAFAQRLTENKRGRQLYFREKARYSPEPLISARGAKTLLGIGVGAMALGMLAPQVTVGKPVNTMVDKRPESDFTLPQNMLNRYNNRVTVQHVPSWVEGKKAMINQAKREYNSMFYAPVNVSLTGTVNL